MTGTVAELELRARGPGPASRAGSRTTRLAAWLALLTPGLIAVVIAAVGPWLAPHPVGRTVAAPFLGPEAGLPLGTDRLGRDVLSQVLHGGRSLLLLPIVATAVTTLVGAPLGMVAAYLRGPIDAVITKLTDVLIALPWLLVLLVLLYGWGSEPAVLVVAVTLGGAPFVARIARAATLQLTRSGFVDQAIALGDGPLAVLVREVLPNIGGPLLADAGLRFAGAIYVVATASFLGFGADPPATDWGQMISENIEGVSIAPWGVAAPALLLAALAISANLLCDRLAKRLAGGAG